MRLPDNRSRVITLTDGPPIRIREADWPTGVQGTVIEGNRRADIRTRTRASASGTELLVYGTAEENDDTLRAGFLEPQAVTATPTLLIRKVAIELMRRAPSSLALHKLIMRAADEAVAKLPLREI
jgi:hypothetical protein